MMEAQSFIIESIYSLRGEEKACEFAETNRSDVGLMFFKLNEHSMFLHLQQRETETIPFLIFFFLP